MGLNKMETYEEVVEYINGLIDQLEADQSWIEGWQSDGHTCESLTYVLSDAGLNVLEEVDREGGEGEGQYYHVVFKVSREGYEDTFIKFVGNYDSWNGVDYYDDFTITKKVQKTVWVWE